MQQHALIVFVACCLALELSASQRAMRIWVCTHFFCKRKESDDRSFTHTHVLQIHTLCSCAYRLHFSYCYRYTVTYMLHATFCTAALTAFVAFIHWEGKTEFCVHQSQTRNQKSWFITEFQVFLAANAAKKAWYIYIYIYI